MRWSRDSEERRTELLTELAAEVQMLTTSKGWREWLTFAARFRTYSLGNQMLIHRQRPDATYVAGFRAWQQMGRQVRAGEKGIAILAPMLRKVVAETPSDDPVTRKLAGFRVVHVFDISQTDGDDIPQMAGPMPAVHVDDPFLLNNLIAAADRAGHPVKLVPEGRDGARGWYSPLTKQITIVTEGYSNGSQIRTMLHELSHACDVGLTDKGRTRAENELIAESSAFIVGTGTFGIAMRDASTFYVASWGGNVDRLVGLAEQVLSTVKRLESLLTPEVVAA